MVVYAKSSRREILVLGELLRGAMWLCGRCGGCGVCDGGLGEL